MIRMSILGRQASHLLLIRTNLGYGTVLTAACAHPGCSASRFLYIMSPEKLVTSVVEHMIFIFEASR
jgi:hypothetical protein